MSRPCSAGASACALNSPNGSAAWPGPPASARTALEDCVGPESLRATPSAIVPGTAPERSSGTGRSVQDSFGSPAQGVKLRPEEACDVAGELASASAGSRAARTRS